jgi:hypothetical protein
VPDVTCWVRAYVRGCTQALSCVREIEVSHWGNIYVEETYEVVSDLVLASLSTSGVSGDLS